MRCLRALFTAKYAVNTLILLLLDKVLIKTRFWQQWAGTSLNERQVKLINRLLDGFDGKLTSSKWAAIAKCSSDTALRDITQLLELGALKKTAGGGRSTGYELSVKSD